MQYKELTNLDLVTKIYENIYLCQEDIFPVPPAYQQGLGKNIKIIHNLNSMIIPHPMSVSQCKDKKRKEK